MKVDKDRFVFYKIHVCFFSDHRSEGIIIKLFPAFAENRTLGVQITAHYLNAFFKVAIYSSSK
jgi:hypothetical protein